VTATTEFLSALAKQDAVLVTVQSHRGSVPREVGAWMAVFAQRQIGTVGGGHLEWQAAQEAQRLLQLGIGAASSLRRYALGPALGQCCGGEVMLSFEPVQAKDVPQLAQRLAQLASGWPPVALFGGGHVGCALVKVLATLPLHLQWIDSRDEIFPDALPTQVVCEHSLPVHAAVPGLSPGAYVLVMSFSHAEDLDVVAACLQRQRAQGDLAFIGLIGSQTKWASFRSRLQKRGFTEPELAQVTCPIGLAGVGGKEPEVIAVAVAAQLLLLMSNDVGQAKVRKASPSD